MKKFYKLASLASALLLSATAATAAPEALYLVGAFNGWITPANDTPQYVLTDEDGDGTYTGSYQIDEGLMQFKVFDAIGGWEDTENYYGVVPGTQIFIYSDVENENILINNTQKTDNFTVNNWKGGVANFSCKYSEVNGEKVLLMSIDAPSQPEKEYTPEHVYLIGDFNYWMEPDDNDTAGALVMNPESENNPFMFSCEQEFNAGEAMFALVIKNEDGKYEMYGNMENDIKLYRYSTGPIVSEGGFAKEDESAGPFSVSNWGGGKISMQFNLYDNSWVLWSEDAELLESPADYRPDKLYVDGDLCGWLSPIESYADQIPTIAKVEEGVYEGTVNVPAAEQSNFRFFSKLEGWSADYSIGSGVDDYSNVPVDITSGVATSNIVMQGLGNWQINNWRGGDLILNVNLNTLTLTIVDPNAGVEGIAAEEIGKAVYFNLQGMPVAEPKDGIYIKVLNGKTSKIAVR